MPHPPDKVEPPAAAAGGSGSGAAKPQTDSRIVADPTDQRQRQIRRLATIELTRLLYGPATDLRPTPPGPAACPATCRYCPGSWAA